MFRLESYITPIILNHVAKYVKNIRPQDAQVSLWEGEVAFQNLDLRLDVLEDELNLPFEFLSGHIHELIIHVPWTKINSEPINITINTIEFVLKLKDINDMEKSSQSSPKQNERKKKTSKIEDSQLGYNTPGLVGKIINNIAVNCHNIILKYVEEDIVVSMNVQLLSFNSASETWSPAFVDMTRLIRKVIEISDLTICLDRRNSMGQIEVCQEPILYKCSLQIRLILKNDKNIKETRIAVTTNLIEMNISSLQFPMAIRLFNLILALKTGDLTTLSVIEEQRETYDDTISVFKEPTWTSTLWSMLPNFSLYDTEEEVKPNENIENVLNVGLYAESFKFTLKLSEFIKESIVGSTKKIRYDPIVSILLKEMYSETVICEKNEWFSSKLGISKIIVEPLGQFAEENWEKYLIKSKIEKVGEFTLESLFDSKSSLKDSITNISEYLSFNTENYLIRRAPCFSLETIKYKETGDNDKSQEDFCETQYRLILSSLNICFNTTAYKILDTITDLISLYDYPPYIKKSIEKNIKLYPPLLEDYDSLMSKIPMRTFKFKLRKVTIKVYPKKELYLKKEKRAKTIKKLSKKCQGKLPYLAFTFKSANGEWMSPQNQELLINTTCQLPLPPSELLESCYEKFFLSMKHISVDLCNLNFKYQMLLIPLVEVQLSKLLYHNLWINQSIPELKGMISLNDFVLRTTKPGWILTINLIKTIFSFDYKTLMEIAQSSIRTDFRNINLNEIETFQKKFEINLIAYNKLISTKGFLQSLKADIGVGLNKKILMESNEKSNQYWVEWSIQIPKKYDDTEFSSIFDLNIQNFNVHLNETVIKFLEYKENIMYSEFDNIFDCEPPLENETNIDKKTFKKSGASSSRKISYPEETIHISSEKDGEHVTDVVVHKDSCFKNCLLFRKIFYILKFAILNICVDSGKISFKKKLASNNLNDHETLTICIPKVIAKSSSSENFNEYKNFLLKNLPIKRESFPWTFEISSFLINLETKEGLVFPFMHPINSNITVAIDHKIEKVDKAQPLKQINHFLERCDQKRLNNYKENLIKNKENIQKFSKEEDIVSINCDWSNMDVTSIADPKNKSQNDRTCEENKVYISIPTASDKCDDLQAQQPSPTLCTEKDNIAINFHIDTSPILFEIKTSQVYLLETNLEVLIKIFKLLGKPSSPKVIAPLRIVTDFEEDTTIKEFLEMNSCSNSSSKFLEVQSQNVIMSTWLQWTITKIGFNIESNSKTPTKLKIEMEDFIISLDKQAQYIKMKGKLGILSIRYFELNEFHELKMDDSLKFNMKSNNSGLPFFDIIVTIADTKSVFEKMGERKKADFNNQLHEVIVSVRPFEMSLDLEKLLQFFPVICAFSKNVFFSKRESEKLRIESKENNIFSSSQLPLIYFELGGCTFYLPLKSTASAVSVIIMHVNEIKLSPNVKNPLTRKPVRADMFNKAAQMGLLNVRGSNLEDRQYELTFNNISLATTNWRDLLSYMKDHENNLRNANPAFEWNHQHFAKTTLELNEIFNNFVISIVYAPMIVYQQVLVCGQSIEINCETDINVKISTEQITLLSYMFILLARLKNCQSIVSKRENKLIQPEEKFNTAEGRTKDSNRTKKTFIHDAEERYSDSGISMHENKKQRYFNKLKKKTYSKENNKNCPYEISIIAGVFSIECYKTSKCVDKIKKILPLFCCTISQPCMLICQKIYERLCQVSLYNLKIDIGRYNQNDDLNEKKFATNIFDTLDGKLDISGIPRSLFLLKIYNDRSHKLDIESAVSKPIKINLEHRTIEDITQIFLDLYECTRNFIKNKTDIKKVIERGSKLKIIKKNLVNADMFMFDLDQLIIKYEKQETYKIEIICDNFRNQFKFLNRPEKLNIKSILSAFYIKTENKICLHPLSIEANIILNQEKWCSLPLLNANLKINVIQIDIGIENLQNILSAVNCLNENLIKAEEILESFELELKGIHQYSFETFDNIKIGLLEQYSLPNINNKEQIKHKEETYQDDLRAGAFQFVETIDDSILPLPYQIHIIPKNNGIICWRYPQPRKIYKLKIFPIPIPVDNPIGFKGQLEYFSYLYKKFLPYCQFSLSESQNTEIELPKRSITANIWRVIILHPFVAINQNYFDISEEDEELKHIKFEDFETKEENNLILEPKVLVGCMKIDTSFNLAFIPKCEMLIEIACIDLNLQNQEAKLDVKSNLFNELKMSNDFPETETFLSFNLKNISFYAKFFSVKNYTVDTEFNYSLKILDYGFSTMQYLIEETILKHYLLVENESILFNFILDSIKINIDAAILHTLVVSTRQWEERIKKIKETNIKIITRFLIANVTQNLVIFGQTNTIEKVFIQPQEYIMYSFISSLQDPSIVFYNSQNFKEHSNSFIFKMKNSVDYLKFGPTIYVIETKILSATQMSVFIKGQVEFLLMVEEKFKIQFRTQNTDGTYKMNSPEYEIQNRNVNSFCQTVLKNNTQAIRIKYNSKQVKLWSGDIPLSSNKYLPWLVKVPISGSYDFISFWLRIITEEITCLKNLTEIPLRTLIIIWPIYQIKSMFPKKIFLKESSTNMNLECAGRGAFLNLNVPATHETQHNIIFNEGFENVKKLQSCMLSLKTIDWNHYFYFDEKIWTIDNCIREFQKNHKETWPFSDDEEQKILRKCSNKDHSTEMILKMHRSKEFSCALLLEISPWCIFINSLSSSIRIRCIDTGNIIQIESNELSTLFKINCGFLIQVDCSLGWIESMPIYFDDSLSDKRKISEKITIKDSDEIDIIFSGNIIHKSILKSVVENGRKTLLLKPVFVLVNNTDTNFSYIPFCLSYEHKLTREELQILTLRHGILINKQNKNKNLCGMAIDTFYNLSSKQNLKKKFSLRYFLTFFIEENQEITKPIYLEKVFNRNCFSLQENSKSIPLCVSCLEKNGQYFINVFNDCLPTLDIQNCTDLDLLIVQTDSTEHTSDVNVKVYSESQHFEWYQVVKNNSCLFYTPSSDYVNYPDTLTSICNVAFAFFTGEILGKSKSIRWSRPLRINESCEKFFNIPMFGDVKVIVCNRHKITKIFISYIAEKLEFSVKDLRSRLNCPSKVLEQERQNILQEVRELSSQSANLSTNEKFSCVKCNHSSIENNSYCMEINVYVSEIVMNFSRILESKSFRKSEIISIYFDRLITKYESKHKNIKWIIADLQVDNKLYSTGNYDFPVILSAQERSVKPSSLISIYDLKTEICEHEEEALINFNIELRREFDIFELNSVICKIKPIRAYIEDKYLNDLHEFFKNFSFGNVVFFQEEMQVKQVLTKGFIIVPEEIRAKALYLAEPIRLHFFRIEPLSVLFSVHTCIRFYIALDHSPLELAAFEKKSITTLPIRLGYIVGMHYLSGALFGAGWVVGSLEILGSPSGLARCFSMGLRDFVTMPFEGFFRGPWGFIIGITQGSVSLLRNLTAGTVNSVTKLASSVARNIDRLTFDDEHFQRTEIIRRTRPQGFTEGLSQGLTSLGINILGAVGGLARHPLEAQSPVQIVTGVGKGIVGAIAKPLSGAAELVALTGHGVLHSVGFNTQPKQRSPLTYYKQNLSPAYSKILKLLPKVLQNDQILFFHEVTLVVDKKLKRATICMTSTVLSVLEYDKDELSYILPVDRIIASFDENDSTLININLKPKDELVTEFMDKQFAHRRIMDFLKLPQKPEQKRMSVTSLEDLLIANKLSTKLDWSFYISENSGQHLLQYLKIITQYPRKEIENKLNFM